MNVLIPMDLSEVSINAFDYAVNRFPNASFTILHVMNGMVNLKYPVQVAAGVPPDVIMANELEARIRKDLRIKEQGLKAQFEIYYGEPVNVIDKYLKMHEFDCVVIGSRDKYNLLDKVFGTVSLGIIKTSKIPVFVIPKFATYKKSKKVVIASNEQLKDVRLLDHLKAWNKENAILKFLHITNSRTGDFGQAKEAIVAKLYEEEESSFCYEIEEIASNDEAGTILAKAYNYKADLIVSFARNTNFINSLVFRSLSKDLLQKSSIPLLFLHA